MTNLIALPDGTELVGDYRIERVLGAGGFGITYLADELALERRVTIKEYFPSDFAARANSINASPRSQDCDGDYRWGLDRFIEEAQTLAKFNHPHIVRVYRYFRANNTAYMVLHFEEGQSLKNWLKGLGRAPRQKELDRILEPLLQALELIHKADFLHRDIAPDNIIIRKDGNPVLIDFGSARGEIASHSKTVSALVKPGYSPYEQYAETSRQQGPWTDIYALGATLYHAVTGKRPPDAPSRMVNDEYIPARQAALSSYRTRFLRAIDAAMALNIDARPRSIAAWRGELLAPDTPPAQRGSWLSRGRAAQSKEEAAERAFDVVTPDPGMPPPPDAPGPHGGILDFVDGLKRKPLAEALANVEADNPAADEADAAPAEINANEEAAQSPLAKTVKLNTAPPPLFAKKAKKAAPQKGAASSRQRKERKAAALPVPVETRKPARPRANRAGRSGWVSLFLKLILVGGLGTGVIAARDQFPEIDVAAYLPSMGEHSAATTKSSTLPKPRQRPETTASLQQRPAEDDGPANPLLQQLVGHTGAVTALAYSPGGYSIVSAGADATVRIWNASNGSLSRIIPMDHGAATSIALQGEYIATGHADGYVAVWDKTSGHKVADLQRNEASIWSLVFTNVPGRLLAAAHDWKVALWDLRAPSSPVHIFEGHENAVQAIAFAPQGPFLASGGADRTVKLWNLNTLDLVRTYRRHPDFVTAVKFSPDASRVASATLNGDIRLWSTSSQRTYRRLRGHKDSVTALAFSGSGGLLASSSADGTVRLWDVERSRTVKTFASHPGEVTAVDFSPDGSRLISAGDDGKIRVWMVPRRTAQR